MILGQALASPPNCTRIIPCKNEWTEGHWVGSTLRNEVERWVISLALCHTLLRGVGPTLVEFLVMNVGEEESRYVRSASTLRMYVNNVS